MCLPGPWPFEPFFFSFFLFLLLLLLLVQWKFCGPKIQSCYNLHAGPARILSSPVAVSLQKGFDFSCCLGTHVSDLRGTTLLPNPSCLVQSSTVVPKSTIAPVRSLHDWQHTIQRSFGHGEHLKCFGLITTRLGPVWLARVISIMALWQQVQCGVPCKDCWWFWDGIVSSPALSLMCCGLPLMFVPSSSVRFRSLHV